MCTQWTGELCEATEQIDCIGMWLPCTPLTNCTRTFEISAPALNGGTCEAQAGHTVMCEQDVCTQLELTHHRTVQAVPDSNSNNLNEGDL